MLISIHAPLTGCDIAFIKDRYDLTAISIHAPLTGCDRTKYHPYQLALMYFNPRTPYGMRLFCLWNFFIDAVISIHAPLTGCDDVVIIVCLVKSIFQSTHPLRDATVSFTILIFIYVNFNPRTPYGMRLIGNFFKVIFNKFQSTHPLRDATP